MQAQFQSGTIGYLHRSFGKTGGLAWARVEHGEISDLQFMSGLVRKRMIAGDFLYMEGPFPVVRDVSISMALWMRLSQTFTTQPKT